MPGFHSFRVDGKHFEISGAFRKVFIITLSLNRMTRRSGIYLQVPQRNAGLVDPHSLHIF